MGRLTSFLTGHDRSIWPVVMLLLTVLIPSIGVIWMMRTAMDSERLAVQHRLEDVYRVQLESIRRQILDEWQENLTHVEAEFTPSITAAEKFASCLTKLPIDSVLILDPDGGIAYPEPIGTASRSLHSGSLSVNVDPAWSSAEFSEHEQHDLRRASELYAGIATRRAGTIEGARSEQALARTLLRLGRRDEGLNVLDRLSQHQTVRDANGRSFSVDAALRWIEVADLDHPSRQQQLEDLRLLLNRYEVPIPSSQRRFAMHQWCQRAEFGIHASDRADFPTLRAEEIAAALIESPGRTFESFNALHQVTAHGETYWSFTSSSGALMPILSSALLQRGMQAIMAREPMSEGTQVSFREIKKRQETEGQTVPSHQVPAVRLDPLFPDWELALDVTDDALFASAAQARVAFLGWTTAMLVTATLALAGTMAFLMQHQIRTMRLKNDLVATVSHELKTPLSAIRLLVDTLLEGGPSGLSTSSLGASTYEYLGMISNENSRLTRLIDNFLTFSRMDQGKHQFELQPLDARIPLQQAMATFRDRGMDGDVEFTVDTPEPLPMLGDADALCMSVLNLLENAWKYTNSPKKISLRGQVVAADVVIQVADNGIGLAPRATKKIFDRFYQVDQQLTRTKGGCGLGLSIVRFIVQAHRGEAKVSSQLGVGSTFSLVFPALLDSDTNARLSSRSLTRDDPQPVPLAHELPGTSR